MTEPILTVSDIRKSFFGVEVLHGVSLQLYPGEVHGLVGENGAGKSTLMKIIAGVHQRDSGHVHVAGREVHFTHPLEAAAAGVATVHQEFNLLADRTVAQNVFLGREPRRFGLVNTAKMRADTAELLRDLGITQISPDSLVGNLTVAEQQLVEIVEALAVDARVLAMDEPTAALADHEVALLYDVIARLRERDVAILYVSHRLKEIFDLCHTITILKDGQLVDTQPASELTESELVRKMVGRPITAFFPGPEPGTRIGEPVLTVTGGGNDQLQGIDLTLRRGEVLGIAGLQGSGRTELAEAIFGAAPFTRGEIHIDDAPVRIRTPRSAIRHGIALVTEDRKRTGLALRQSALDNALLTIRSVFPGRTRANRQQMPNLFTSLEVVSTGPNQEVQTLSGGNQQKVVLAKWLTTEPAIILLDEPTRGIDVGAKVAVYQLIRKLAHSGVAILFISSELPEILGLADRVVVMRDGEIAGELGAAPSEEAVVALATGAGAGEVTP